jgi:hypothetical protein
LELGPAHPVGGAGRVVELEVESVPWVEVHDGGLALGPPAFDLGAAEAFGVVESPHSPV